MVAAHLPATEYAAMPKAEGVTGSLAWPPDLIVIHDTGNNGSTRYDEAHYASTRTDAQSHWTSAHFYVDKGGILGSLPLTLRAWAAFSYANAHGIHIEMCRERDGSIHPDTIRNTTRLVRSLLALGAGARRKLLPAEVAAGQRGICGHYDITVGLHVGDHTDPGKDFDWAGFMAQVNQAATVAGEDEDDMGASFGPIEIQREGVTSLTIPPVQGGVADPREAWLNITNDVGDKVGTYALRIWYTTGNGSWAALDKASVGLSEGVVAIGNGQRYSKQLPKGTCGLTITRMAASPPNGEVYAGHLTCCIERGPVQK